LENNDNPLPRSRAALDRLELALQRLEGVAVHSHGDQYLAEELRLAREDYARLDDTTRMVEARLDGVIGRLKLMIED
jgi:hypothetical protein